MKWYCVISGMVEVEADTEDEARGKACRAYRNGMDDITCEEATSEVECNDTPENVPHCLTCAHCCDRDCDYHTATCDIDRIPNGHKELHTCCLYEHDEALELV